MADPVLVDGIPAKITAYDFRRYNLASFPSLASTDYDDLILGAIDDVYGMFPFVHDLWSWHPPRIWYEKVTQCYRLLTAWYIADIYPDLAARVPLMGGFPVKSKKADAVAISYHDVYSGDGKDLLAGLKSNPWGMKAYMMIKTAAKRAVLRNCRIV